jgi:hypothetical protein
MKHPSTLVASLTLEAHIGAFGSDFTSVRYEDIGGEPAVLPLGPSQGANHE